MFPWNICVLSELWATDSIASWSERIPLFLAISISGYTVETSTMNHKLGWNEFQLPTAWRVILKESRIDHLWVPFGEIPFHSENSISILRESIEGHGTMNGRKKLVDSFQCILVYSTNWQWTGCAPFLSPSPKLWKWTGSPRSKYFLPIEGSKEWTWHLYYTWIPKE